MASQIERTLSLRVQPMIARGHGGTRRISKPYNFEHPERNAPCNEVTCMCRVAKGGTKHQAEPLRVELRVNIPLRTRRHFAQ